jgi:hypothetical protein
MLPSSGVAWSAPGGTPRPRTRRVTPPVRENRLAHRQDPVRRTIMMPTGKHSLTMFTGAKQRMYLRTLIDMMTPQPVLEAGHETCGKWVRLV